RCVIVPNDQMETLGAVKSFFHPDSNGVTVGANLSRAISGDTGDDKTLSGGAYAQFDARYASGTLNVNSAADGYIKPWISLVPWMYQRQH
ncbi:hypothetical protein O5343_26555, partial [Escherichia coli]|nr:hypothetical protein [Escherichia coli]